MAENTPQRYSFCVEAEEAGTRLDAMLAARGLEGLSRSRLKALIMEGQIVRGGVVCDDPAQKVKEGEEYVLTVPAPRLTEIVPREIPFGIVYEDEYLLVVDKPAGLTVHPAAGNTEHTLVNALLAYCGNRLSGIGGELRPGIVHRLDKDTSGLMVVAKSDAAHHALAEQLLSRRLSRIYKTLVWGRLKPSQGRVEAAIGRSPANRKKMAVVKKGGKPAATQYVTEVTYDSHPTTKHPPEPVASLVRCKLETGRTHQIRVHLTHLGHALVGDSVYGGRAAAKLGRFSEQQLPQEARDVLLQFPRQALHAAEIGFLHPASGEEMRFTCNLPTDMSELVDGCGQWLVPRNA